MIAWTLTLVTATTMVTMWLLSFKVQNPQLTQSEPAPDESDTEDEPWGWDCEGDDDDDEAFWNWDDDLCDDDWEAYEDNDDSDLVGDCERVGGRTIANN